MRPPTSRACVGWRRLYDHFPGYGLAAIGGGQRLVSIAYTKAMMERSGSQPVSGIHGIICFDGRRSIRRTLATMRAAMAEARMAPSGDAKCRWYGQLLIDTPEAAHEVLPRVMTRWQGAHRCCADRQPRRPFRELSRRRTSCARAWTACSSSAPGLRWGEECAGAAAGRLVSCRLTRRRGASSRARPPRQHRALLHGQRALPGVRLGTQGAVGAGHRAGGVG